MTFSSTRGADRDTSFRKALFLGLASDGGLFHPSSVPDLRDFFLSQSKEVGFVSLASSVAVRLLCPGIEEGRLIRIVERSFPFSPKLRRLNDSLMLLELHHGPSYAFKDFGAGFLSSTMQDFLLEDRQEAVVLVATSGDTGSAVAKAFHGKDRISIVILYPSGRVSPLQEKQLTTLGGNVCALEVKGTFDDCQRLVKEAFMNRQLRRELRLTSANSINLGRLIPQCFYYIYAYTRLKERSPLLFCVPSGNFGNLAAGVYAWQWGLPVDAFLAATNINDAVPEYLAEGVFTPRASVSTLSNSMDVGHPSNFERLLAIFDGSWQKMRSLISGDVVTDTETLAAMREVWERYGLLIDPHTAVGYLSASRYLEKQEAFHGIIVILSTAHPAKFRETVKEATGEEPELPEALARALSLPKRSVVMDNRLDDLVVFLRTTFR